MRKIYFRVTLRKFAIKKAEIFFRTSRPLALLFCACCMAFFALACKNKAPEVHKAYKQKPERVHEQEEHEKEEAKGHSHKDEKEEHSHSEKTSGHGAEEGHEHGGGEFGPKKGVQKYEEGKGIVLAPVAEKRLGVGYESLARFRKGKDYLLPASALIREENEIGVYVRTGDWLRFYPVRFLRQGPRTALVTGNLPTNPLARLVTKSAALVRLSELNAAGASGEGHGH